MDECVLFVWGGDSSMNSANVVRFDDSVLLKEQLASRRLGLPLQP